MLIPFIWEALSTLQPVKQVDFAHPLFLFFAYY